MWLAAVEESSMEVTTHAYWVSEPCSEESITGRAVPTIVSDITATNMTNRRPAMTSIVSFLGAPHLLKIFPIDFLLA